MTNLLFTILFLFSSTLFAYEDSDLDGVADAQDRCPNTPFSDLVDIHGCSIQSLASTPYNFDIIMGISYADNQALDATETLSPTFQVDYYYKNFSLQLSTSYFSTSGNGDTQRGINDSYLGASYQLKASDSLYVGFGVGVLLPTYKSSVGTNKTDYLGSISFSYLLDAWTLFGNYSYTMTNDTDNNSIKIQHQNTNALSSGVGYYMSDNFYASTSYNVSSSIYAGTKNITTASLYGYYSINKNWFTTLSYARGLSASATKNYVALSLGYSF